MKKTSIWILRSLIVLLGSLPLMGQEQTVEGPPTDTAAWALSRYVTNLKYEDLPANVVAKAKERILDSLGTAYGAYNAPSMVALRKVIAEEGGTPESTVIGSGQKTSAVNATMVNGAMIRYLDFSDTYWSTLGFMHPSNEISTALAVAERQHASGKDLILATVLAYEIQSRLADTFKWGKFEQHSGAGFTAPIVAGKLIGLTAEQMANAIGIGASHNFALAGDYGVGYTSNMKAFAYAAGSGSGVLAALMAQQGFTGPVTIIETFNQSFMGNVSLAPLINPDPRGFLILQAETKPYEAFHVSHSAIAGVIQLTKEHSIKPDQIEKILIRGLPSRQTSEARRDLRIPATHEDADHNLPYLLAAGIVDGAVGPDQLALAQWKDPEFQQLMSKMWFQGDAEMTKNFPEHWDCDVTITMKDGQVYTTHIDLPKGQPGNPMTEQEIEAKFSNMALKLMPRSQVDQIIQTVNNLENLNDVSALTKLLAAQKTSRGE
jgi:2-methylcitrate dehydratase